MSDLADFHEGGAYALIEFIGRRRLPISLPVTELQGAEVWHHADRPIDLRQYEAHQPPGA